MSHPYLDLPRPIILGHRGAAGVAPENTLASFERALAEGADIIETDVQVTRDGVPVLLHDPAVDRTTDGHGTVAELDLAQLGTLDAGYHFGLDADPPHPYRGRGMRIPTLAEAFEALPDARFNIEIKADSEVVVDAVVDLVLEHERESRTLVTSGEDAIQARLRESLARKGAHPALGASLADILEVVRASLESRPPTTDSMVLQIPDRFAGEPMVTPELITHAHAHDIQIHVWTINEPAEIRALLELGVDGIVTDHPGRMAELVGRRLG